MAGEIKNQLNAGLKFVYPDALKRNSESLTEMAANLMRPLHFETIFFQPKILSYGRSIF